MALTVKKSTIKRRRHSRSGFLALVMLVIILFLMVAVILLQFPFFANKGRPRIDKEQISGIEAFPLDAVNAKNTYALPGNQVMKVSDGQIQLTNLQGEVELSLDGNITDPKLLIRDNMFLLVEQNGFHYYLFKDAELVYSGKTDHPIISYNFAPDGHAALVMEAEGTKGLVSVLDPKGELLFTLTVQDNKDSGFVLSTAFSYDCKSLYVSMINVAGAVQEPIINAYSLENQNLAKIIAQYKPSVKSPLPLIYSFDDGNTVFAGAEAMVLLRSGELSQPGKLNGFTHGGKMKDAFFFIGSSNAAGPYYFNVVKNLAKFPGKPENGYQLPDIPREVQSNGNYVAVLVGDDMYRFSAGSPNTPAVFAMQGKVQHFAVDSHGNILCVCSDGVRKIIN